MSRSSSSSFKAQVYPYVTVHTEHREIVYNSSNPELRISMHIYVLYESIFLMHEARSHASLLIDEGLQFGIHAIY